MRIIVHHALAWKGVVEKYNLGAYNPPTEFPVVISFVGPAEAPAPNNTNSTAIFTPTDAVSLLAATPATGLKLVSAAIMSKATFVLGQALTQKSAEIPKPLGLGEPIEGTVELFGVEDFITGEPTTVTVTAEDATESLIPGMGKIPVDSSKYVPEHRIAELADDTEHVLDVERAV